MLLLESVNVIAGRTPKYAALTERAPCPPVSYIILAKRRSLSAVRAQYLQ